MVCNAGCRKCDSVSGTGDIIITNIIFPQVPLKVNASIVVSVTINSNIWLGDGFVCLYDVDKGTCLESQYFTYYTPGTQEFTFYTFMEAHDMHFNVSIIRDDLIFGPQCEDLRLFSVTLEPEPSIGFSCTNLGCVQDGGIYFDKTACEASGCVSGAISCKEGETNILGMCVPDPMLFVGGLLFAVMLIGGGRKD